MSALPPFTKKSWLLKSEPSTYSFDDLVRDGKTSWNGIRNYQARNFLREISKGDLLFIYHSGKDKSVIGIAQAISAPKPEANVPKLKNEDWSEVDIRALSAFVKPVSLSTIKADPALRGLLLIKHTRLSVMPVSHAEAKHLAMLGGL